MADEKDAAVLEFKHDSEALSDDILIDAFTKSGFNDARSSAALIIATARSLAFGNIPLSTAVSLLIMQYEASMKVRRPQAAAPDDPTPAEPPAKLKTWLQNLKN